MFYMCVTAGVHRQARKVQFGQKCISDLPRGVAGVVLGGQTRALYKNNVGPLCYDELKSTQALAWSDMVF